MNPNTTMLGMNASDDPILRRFRAALNEIYDEPLERVMLFGSWEQGSARAARYAPPHWCSESAIVHDSSVRRLVVV